MQSGGTVTIDLRLSGLGINSAPSVGVYDIDIGFDPALLAYTGIAWGDGLDLFGLGDIRAATPGAGTVNLFELSLESAADLDALQQANFLIASLSFAGGADGNSFISAKINAIGDL